MTDSVGEAFIEVHADAAGLTTEVRVAAARASQAADIELDVTVDNNRISNTVRTVARDAQGQFARAGAQAGEGFASGVKKGLDARKIRSLSELNFSLAKVAAGAAIAGASFIDYTTIAEGALAATVALGSALGETAIASASIAGVVGALGAAFATYKIATIGVEDALKATVKAQDELAATGEVSEATLEAQAAAMENLAPSARRFVREIGAARSEFTTFRQGIQGAAFEGLDDSLRSLTGLLPQVQDEFEGIAGTLNEAAQGTADWISASEQSTRIQGVLTDLDGILQSILPGLGAIGRGIFDLFEGLLPSGQRLAESITEIGESFESWAEGVVASGELDETMRHAQETAGELVSILGNVGSILLTVFGAGAETGQGLLTTIDDATESLSDFLKTAEGQAGLEDFFDSTSAAADALATAFDVLGPAASGIFEALRVLGPSLDSLREALSPIAEAISEQLAGALVALANAVAPVIEGVAALASAFPPDLAGSIVAVAIALQLLNRTSATVGPKFTSAATAIKTSTTGMSTGLSKLNTASVAAKGGLLALAGAGGFLALQKGAEDSNEALSALGGAATGAAAGFMVGGPWGAAVGGAVGFLSQLTFTTHDAENAITDLGTAFEQTGGKVTPETTKLAADATKGLASELDAVGISQKEFNTALQEGGPQRDAMIEQLTRLSTGSKDTFVGVGQSATALGQEADAANTLLPALTGVADKQDEARLTAENAAIGYRLSAEGMDAAADASLNLFDAQTAMAQALKDASTLAEQTTGKVKRHSDAWFALRGSISQVGHQFDQMPEKYQKSEAGIKKNATAIAGLAGDLGLGKKATEDLIRTVLDVPNDVTITFKENGGVEVNRVARELLTVGNDVAGEYVMTFRTRVVGGIPQGLAGGGGRSVSDIGRPNAQGGIHTVPHVVTVGDRSPELVVPMDPKAQLSPGVEQALMTLATQRGAGTGRGPVELTVVAPTDDPVGLGFKLLDRLAVAGVL